MDNPVKVKGELGEVTIARDVKSRTFEVVLSKHFTVEIHHTENNIDVMTKQPHGGSVGKTLLLPENTKKVRVTISVAP